jgi:hypothetical protein
VCLIIRYYASRLNKYSVKDKEPGDIIHTLAYTKRPRTETASSCIILSMCVYAREERPRFLIHTLHVSTYYFAPHVGNVSHLS